MIIVVIIALFILAFVFGYYTGKDKGYRECSIFKSDTKWVNEVDVKDVMENIEDSINIKENNFYGRNL